MELTMGDRIRFVRQFRGLTQTELAEKVGLPPGENGRIRISQYENGTHVPKEEMLEKISSVLGVTSLYLSSKPHTNMLDFAFHLLEYDRDFPIMIEKHGKDDYSLHFSNELMFDFLDDWIQKKADLEEGRISKEDYIEWTINFK